MSTIANAKVEHNYNRYNGYFFGCLPINNPHIIKLTIGNVIHVLSPPGNSRTKMYIVIGDIAIART